MLTLKILGLFLSIAGSHGCVVDRVEGNVAVLSCDDGDDVVTVDAALLGPEGTVYGTVNSVSASYDGSAGKIVL